MGLLDKFLNAIKLNDDYDEDDDEFLDDDENEEEYEDVKPKKRFFQKFSEDFDDDDDDDDEDDIPVKTPKPSFSSQSRAASPTFRTPGAGNSAKSGAETVFKADKNASKSKAAKKSKITPLKRKGTANMEVNVIRPSSMEDTKDIADTLLESCTVVLNLEGLDVDTAQRIIDFTCGACYSLGGSLQKISTYIFILTPADVDISGDVQSILSGAFDIPSMKSQY